MPKCSAQGTREEKWPDVNATYATTITRPMNAKPRMNGRRHEVVEYCRSTVTKISLDNRWIRVFPRIAVFGALFYSKDNTIRTESQLTPHSKVKFIRGQLMNTKHQAADSLSPHCTVANIIKLKDGKWNVSTIT